MTRLKLHYMLRQKLVPFIVLLMAAQGIQAQNDTLYYDANWRKTVKDSASYYRPEIKKMGDRYLVRDYFISGELQMEGYSKSDTRDIWQGKVTWYNKDGSIHQQGDYVNGRLDGDFITFLKGERLLAHYENGRFSKGKQNVSYRNGTNYFTVLRNDTLVEITYDKDLNGIRFERYSKDKDYDLVVKYYGENGKYLGERLKRSNGNFDGIEVFYYYAPMRVRTINHFKRGRQFATSTYYPNGKPRELFNESPELTKTFYDAKGDVIGKMTYQADQYGLKPYDGTLINFMYGTGGEAYKKSSKLSYESGTKTEDVIYHENQRIKTRTTFNAKGEKLEQIGFDEAGNEISRMEYRNYLPYNGTEILADKVTVYEEGKLVKETTYYAKTKQVFSVKTTDGEKYFDTEGQLLGTLELDTTENYPKPLKGTRYYQDYYGGIGSFEKYQDGDVIERTSFRDRSIGENDKKKTFKTIEIYNPGSYDKAKEIRHYSNVQVRSVISFKKYIEQEGTYYDMQGNLLGQYDYVKKEGTRYKFFVDSDEIEEMEEIKNGQRIRFKRYTYGSNRQYGSIDPMLIEDIDTNCCASFYGRNGELVAKMTFKDKKPWSGTWYDTKTYELFSIEKGKRNGSYQKLDYNMTPLVEGTYLDDQRNGTFTTYSKTGGIKSTEKYENDKLNGLSTYYGDNGEIIGTMVYKAGAPMDGKRTISGNYGRPLTTEEYAEGNLLKKIEFWEKGKRITTYENDNRSNTVVFHADSEIKRLTFSSENAVLDGKVTHFDREGKVTDTAEVKNGRLVSGSLYLAPTGGDANMKYYKLTKGDDTLELVIYGEDNKVLFKAEEHLYFGSATYYLQNLNIYLDYLSDKKLY